MIYEEEVDTIQWWFSVDWFVRIFPKGLSPQLDKGGDGDRAGSQLSHRSPPNPTTPPPPIWHLSGCECRPPSLLSYLLSWRCMQREFQFHPGLIKKGLPWVAYYTSPTASLLVFLSYVLSNPRKEVRHRSMKSKEISLRREIYFRNLASAPERWWDVGNSSTSLTRVQN